MRCMFETRGRVGLKLIVLIDSDGEVTNRRGIERHRAAVRDSHRDRGEILRLPALVTLLVRSRFDLGVVE